MGGLRKVREISKVTGFGLVMLTAATPPHHVEYKIQLINSLKNTL